MMVIIDRIGIDDLESRETPNLQYLFTNGSAGLMNVRILNDKYGPDSFLVIGAGGRVFGGASAGLAFNPDELLTISRSDQIRAGSVYTSLTEKEAPAGSVCNLFIEETKKKSDTILSTSDPGLLGQALAESFRKTAVLGNSDILAFEEAFHGNGGLLPYGLIVPDERNATGFAAGITPHREVACVAMDNDGIVSSGDVSSHLTRVDQGRSSLATDFEALTAEAAGMTPQADFLVVDMGETSRADARSPISSSGTLKRARKQALKQCDKALGVLLKNFDRRSDLVVVCAPTPSRHMVKDGELLTPIVVCGPGFEPGTALCSQSTRRPGVVTNYDVAPTVLEFLGVKIPAEMTGRPMYSSSSKTSVGDQARIKQDFKR